MAISRPQGPCAPPEPLITLVPPGPGQEPCLDSAQCSGPCSGTGLPSTCPLLRAIVTCIGGPEHGHRLPAHPQLPTSPPLQLTRAQSSNDITLAILQDSRPSGQGLHTGISLRPKVGRACVPPRDRAPVPLPWLPGREGSCSLVASTSLTLSRRGCEPWPGLRSTQAGTYEGAHQ